ncbi:YezD family protein [Paenibacillus thermoaerophilus]|uniref:YezD family protein n=1 Tax=Paenibacillus thermoaerophilus TaxID=1215385 RepID=A0ABW2V193_9BACL|nr:YezD family protein [Paenibacillus thermoaerophilus]TMV19014.1 DUF2292 domain-containing protein [Paenibacillus thermoaerophilus]
MPRSVHLDEWWINRIADSVNGLEYGAVQIIVHDGRIVQIERTERKRFEAERAKEATSARPDRRERLQS